MFPRFKALRSCDSDVLLPQQAHDDRLGHRCHEIPLPWTCHDLLWVAQCWLLPIDALCLTDFHKLPCFRCAGSCPVTIQVLRPKSSSLPAFWAQETTTRWTGPWMTSRCPVWGGGEKGGWFLWRLQLPKRVSYGRKSPDVQEFIDIVETIYRGARKGRGLVMSPKAGETWWNQPSQQLKDGLIGPKFGGKNYGK